jgi:hypothetical protein
VKISKPSPPAIVTSVMPAASAARRPVHHDSRSAQLTYVNGIPTNPVQIEISRNVVGPIKCFANGVGGKSVSKSRWFLDSAIMVSTTAGSFSDFADICAPSNRLARQAAQRAFIYRLPGYAGTIV